MTLRKTRSKDNRAVKVTISLPTELLQFADEQAEHAGTSRSQAIAEALRMAKRAERDRLMAAAFRFYADHDVELAEEGMAATNEVWPRD
jgi:metal-responsive CopG/Arc/MetJ family transcriptional regulator